MLFRLPDHKLKELQKALSSNKITLKQMQFLLGYLVFACRVIPMGRAYCRRLSLSTKGIKQPHHFIRVTKDMKSELTVWSSVLSRYNGCSCWQTPDITNSCINLQTDTAGSSGIGGYFGGMWFSVPWPSA